MGEQSFLIVTPPVPHSGVLPYPQNMREGVRSSATLPPTQDYPELTTPYSAVSSFNFPTRADSSLLTPVSTAASPPLKFSGRYVPPSTQEATSPGSSKMYAWPSHFDAGQSSSPMPQPPTVASEFLGATYLSDDRRPTPGPPEHAYTGVYGVSEGPAHHDIQHDGGPYYSMNMASVEHPGQMMMREDPSMSLEVDRGLARHPSSAPMLNHPHPTAFRSDRRDSSDGAMLPSSARVPRAMNGSPGRRVQGTPRVKKPRPQVRKTGQQRKEGSDDSEDAFKNCLGEEVPPRLKDTCPQEERCIFDSRWRHRRKKGQDMWESIQADFEKQFNKSHGKEMLQMKFKRARCKYYVWLPRDEEILRNAYMELEKRRYELMLDIFHEMGGSRNMQLNAGDIEVKVVNDLKLEEGLYMDENADVPTRRRRKVDKGRGRPKRAGEETEMAFHDDMGSVSSHNTVHEDEVVNQVHSRRNMSWDGECDVSPEMMDYQMMGGRAMKMDPTLMPEYAARQVQDPNRLNHNTYNQRKGA